MKLPEVYHHIRTDLFNDAESYTVVERINDFRTYWKPINTKVLLLAESHVWTLEEEINSNVAYPKNFLDFSYPSGFARFVYCLAYGEDEVVKGQVESNNGTYQYWELLFSCVNKINTNIDFSPILKKFTPNLKERLNNKANLLKEMKRRGIWLLDASIVSLYKPGSERPADKNKEKIIRYCWDNYFVQMINQSHPNFLICIGKGVEKPLGERIKILFRNNYVVIPQPQARISKEERLECFKTYYDICSLYAS